MDRVLQLLDKHRVHAALDAYASCAADDVEFTQHIVNNGVKYSRLELALLHAVHPLPQTYLDATSPLKVIFMYDNTEAFRSMLVDVTPSLLANYYSLAVRHQARDILCVIHAHQHADWVQVAYLLNEQGCKLKHIITLLRHKRLNLASMLHKSWSGASMICEQLHAQFELDEVNGTLMDYHHKYRDAHFDMRIIQAILPCVDATALRQHPVFNIGYLLAWLTHLNIEYDYDTRVIDDYVHTGDHYAVLFTATASTRGPADIYVGVEANVVVQDAEPILLLPNMEYTLHANSDKVSYNLKFRVWATEAQMLQVMRR